MLYLEALADADDETESIQYRFIAKWIKRFINDLPEEVDTRFQQLKDVDAGKTQKPDLSGGGTPWMESDGSPEISLTEEGL